MTLKTIVLTVRDSIIDKLAAYEDTGLTPEEIERLKAENEQLKAENERLHKLVNPELLERSKNDGGQHQSNVARETH